jgi:hypothetical protein
MRVDIIVDIKVVTDRVLNNDGGHLFIIEV